MSDGGFDPSQISLAHPSGTGEGTHTRGEGIPHVGGGVSLPRKGTRIRGKGIPCGSSLPRSLGEIRGMSLPLGRGRMVGQARPWSKRGREGSIVSMRILRPPMGGEGTHTDTCSNHPGAEGHGNLHTHVKERKRKK